MITYYFSNQLDIVIEDGFTTLEECKTAMREYEKLSGDECFISKDYQ